MQAMINPIERITQNRIIQLFQKNWVTPMEIGKREHNSNVEEAILKQNLLQRGYSETLADKAVKEVCDLATTNSGNLYHRNKMMYSLLRYGVKARPDLGEQFDTIFPIDWNDFDKNEFGIAEEVTLSKGENNRRPDVVLYINGIAIGVLELKRGTTDISESINQSISNQRELFNKWFYTTVQLLMAGNNTQGLKYGTIKTENKYYLSWKEDEADNEGYKLDKYLKKLCQKQRLLDLIYNGVIFDAGKEITSPSSVFCSERSARICA